MGKLSELDIARQELNKLEDYSVSDLALETHSEIKHKIALLEDLGYEFMYIQDSKGNMITSIRRKRDA